MSNIVRSLALPENVEQLKEYLLYEMGIRAEVVVVKEGVAIKVYHHFSLLAIITKVHLQFDFEVFYKKEQKEYVICLL